MVWPHGGGVASLASAAGPRRIYFAGDGIGFEPRNPVSHPPRAPGAFRNDDYRDGIPGQGIRWGISHAGAGRDLYLVRFDCRFTRASAARPTPVPYDNAPPVGNLRFDFETGDLQGWTVVEGKFDLVVSDQPSLVGWPDVAFNKQGKYHLSTVERSDGLRGDDSMTGVLESPRFVLHDGKLSMLVGGGDGPDTYVALCTADGKEVLRAGGTNSPVLQRVNWDASSYESQEVFLRIVDRKRRVWAHITFDDFSAEGQMVAGPATTEVKPR
jgi:hypothetical protein